MPSLSSLLATLKPFVEVSTMKAVMPLEAALGSVLAYTTITCASGPCEVCISMRVPLQKTCDEGLLHS
jgi:hypothetical protein